MKKIRSRCLAMGSLIITAMLAGTPLTAYAAPEVVAWGSGQGYTDAPSGLSNVVAISVGWLHSLALTSEGRVVAWGDNSGGQTHVPTRLSNAVGIAAGGIHSLALTTGGRVLAWGDNSNGQTNVPSELSNVVAIAAGQHHSLALTAGGRVMAWGENTSGQTNVPSGLSNLVAVAAGRSHSLALTADGRVVAWGYNFFGQSEVPSGLSNVVGIAAGADHSLALTAEGRLVAWGDNSSGHTYVPSGLSNVVEIATGDDHSLALTAEGRVMGWGGLRIPGQPDMPDGLSNVVGIAAGGARSLALIGLSPGLAAPAWVGPRLLVGTADRPFHHRVIAKNGVDTYGAAGLPPGLAIDPATGLITGLPTQAGTYALVLSATNRVGSCAWTVTILVNHPAVPRIVSRGVVPARLDSEFSYAVVAYNAPEWYGASGLPAGWVIDAQTGVISGGPVAPGDFVVSLVASNRYGLDAGLLTIRVSPVVAWGNETALPSGLSNVVAIAAGGSHSLALTDEGGVVGWGVYNAYPYSAGSTVTVPDGLSNVVAIAAGGSHSLALTDEGRVWAWGYNYFGQTNVPNGLSHVVAIAAGKFHSLALTDEGRVVGWGARPPGATDYYCVGQATVPNGLNHVVAIAAGGFYSLALTDEGRVVQWPGQTNVPNGLSHVVAIAAGAVHSLALTTEGRVVAWGGLLTPTDPPGGLSNVVAIAAAGSMVSGMGYSQVRRSLALTAEGVVVGWGDISGQGLQSLPFQYPLDPVPNGMTNMVAMAAGESQTLALLRQPTVPTPRLELSRVNSGLKLQARGAPGISCQLLRASGLPGPWLPAEPVTFTNQLQLLEPLDNSTPAQFFRLLRK